MDVVKLKLDEASDDMKAKYSEQLAHLEERKSSLEKKYHALADVIEEIIRVEIIDELDETPDMQHLAAELIQPNILKE